MHPGLGYPLCKLGGGQRWPGWASSHHKPPLLRIRSPSRVVMKMFCRSSSALWVGCQAAPPESHRDRYYIRCIVPTQKARALLFSEPGRACLPRVGPAELTSGSRRHPRFDASLASSPILQLSPHNLAKAQAVGRFAAQGFSAVCGRKVTDGETRTVPGRPCWGLAFDGL